MQVSLPVYQNSVNKDNPVIMISDREEAKGTHSPYPGLGPLLCSEPYVLKMGPTMQSVDPVINHQSTVSAVHGTGL